MCRCALPCRPRGSQSPCDRSNSSSHHQHQQQQQHCPPPSPSHLLRCPKQESVEEGKRERSLLSCFVCAATRTHTHTHARTHTPSLPLPLSSLRPSFHCVRTRIGGKGWQRRAAAIQYCRVLLCNTPPCTRPFILSPPQLVFFSLLNQPCPQIERRKERDRKRKRKERNFANWEENVQGSDSTKKKGGLRKQQHKQRARSMQEWVGKRLDSDTECVDKVWSAGDDVLKLDIR